MRHYILNTLVAILAVGYLVGSPAPGAASSRVDPELQAQFGQDLENVKDAMLRSFAAHGQYPSYSGQLIVDTWALPGFYHNPFLGGDANKRNAYEVPFGWSAGASGNFTVLRRFGDSGTAKGVVVDYIILGYGPSLDGSQDVDGDGESDGVILVLSSQASERWKPGTWYDSNWNIVSVSAPLISTT